MIANAKTQGLEGGPRDTVSAEAALDLLTIALQTRDTAAFLRRPSGAAFEAPYFPFACQQHTRQV